MRLRWLFALVALCLSSTLLTAQSSEPVSAKLSGDAIIVKNGLIQIKVSRADGTVLSLERFDQGHYHDLGVTSLKAAYVAPSDGERNDPSLALYWDANADVPSAPEALKANAKGYYRVRPGTARTELVTNTPERAEIVTIAPPVQIFPLTVEHHYVIFRGKSGLYAYVTLSHGKDAPAMTLFQSRFVAKTVMDGTFDHWAVGDGKFVAIPQSAVTKKLTDATFELADGTVKTKYMNSVYWAQVPVYGYTGKRLGLFMEEISPEYHNGGPIKQGQTVHDNVLLRVLQSVHFGASPVELKNGELWTKTYGPIFLYANQGDSKEAQWQDAIRQFNEEKSAWPYQWVDSVNYARERGSITGTVMLGDKPATQATAILSPVDENWSAESKGYNYWSALDNKGNFRIDKIVPGRYSLFISGADQPTDFVRHDIVIKANQSNDLGIVPWSPVTHGETIFQIGRFDRSSGEFRNGDDARSFQMFTRYAKQFPHDVDFTVGKSDPKLDWNYAHWSIYSESPAWKIRFDNKSTKGKATLTVGFASSQPAHGPVTDLRLRVNGKEIAQIHLPKTGTAGYRGGTQDSQYNLRVIEFDASLLKDGQNIIELQHADAIPASRYVSKDETHAIPSEGAPGQVMYDAIRLEVKPDQPVASTEAAHPAQGKLIAQDDFTHGLAQWRIELQKTGEVTAKNGVLDINVPAGATLWFNEKLKGRIAVEYDAIAISANGVNDRVSDLNCFWMATEKDSNTLQTRSGAFPEYNTLKTYYVGLGGNGNSTTRFRRYIGDAKERPLLANNDHTEKEYLLEANQQQHIRLVADHGLITYERNGKRIFTYNDESPYEEGWFALRTTFSHLQIRNLRIYQLD